MYYIYSYTNKQTFYFHTVKRAVQWSKENNPNATIHYCKATKVKETDTVIV